MADREKVLNGLRCLSGDKEMVENPCAGCGYTDCPTYANCVAQVARDALELLKEYEKKIAEFEEKLQQAYERGKHDGVEQYLREREEDEEWEY